MAGKIQPGIRQNVKERICKTDEQTLCIVFKKQTAQIIVCKCIMNRVPEIAKQLLK